MKEGRRVFQKYSGVLSFLEFAYSCIPTFLFTKRKLKFSILFRYLYARRFFKFCGNNVSIHKNVMIFHPSNLEVGNNCSIHPLCYIDAEGGISIGNNVSI